MNTAAIRSFLNKVKLLTSNKNNQVVLSSNEARLLAHELSQLLAIAVEQNTTEPTNIQIEVKSNTF